MRTKKVNRYWCDFCGKSGCSASHMKRHESICFLNPHRDCPECGRKQTDVVANTKIVASLTYEADFGGAELNVTPDEIDCPVCTLAAVVKLNHKMEPGERWISYNYETCLNEYRNDGKGRGANKEYNFR